MIKVRFTVDLVFKESDSEVTRVELEKTIAMPAVPRIGDYVSLDKAAAWGEAEVVSVAWMVGSEACVLVDVFLESMEFDTEERPDTQEDMLAFMISQGWNVCD